MTRQLHQQYTNTEVKRIISRLMKYGFNKNEVWTLTQNKHTISLDIVVTGNGYCITDILIRGIEKLFDCSFAIVRTSEKDYKDNWQINHHISISFYKGRNHDEADRKVLGELSKLHTKVAQEMK